MSTKCSQGHLFQNHDDRKLAIVKYNLESSQILTPDGNTDITGRVCLPHFTLQYISLKGEILLFLT